MSAYDNYNPHDYVDQTTINANRYDGNYNRFGKKQNSLYSFIAPPNVQEIREVDVNDLVNDAFIDRLQNVTPDGVRRMDNYILNEPIDLKTSGSKTTIYRDNKKTLSTQDQYYQDNHNQNKPREHNMTTREFNRLLREQEEINRIIERQQFINQIPHLDVSLPVSQRLKAVKQQRKGKIPLDLNFNNEEDFNNLQDTLRKLRKPDRKLENEIGGKLRKTSKREEQYKRKSKK